VALAVTDPDPVVVVVMISPVIVPRGVPVDEADDVVVTISRTVESDADALGSPLAIPFFATSTSPLTHFHCPRFALHTSVAHPAYPHVKTFVEEFGHE
jgi:hypothetical protein